MTSSHPESRRDWVSRAHAATTAAQAISAAGLVVAMDERRPRALIVEDDGIVASSVARLLRAQNIDVVVVRDAEQALQCWREDPPDVALVDIVLPGMDGITFCEVLKQDPASRLTPVVIMTGFEDPEYRLNGIKAGADDFFIKPFPAPQLIARVQALLRMKGHIDDLESAESVLLALARSVEGRDPSTEGHCERLSTNAAELGRRLGLPDEQLVALTRAGQLHDIGKIAVPDTILLKDGPLTPDQWSVMREHPITGEHICRPIRAFDQALPIIRYHHERLDGSGYPDGLIGDAIPMPARVLQVVDIFDALTMERPYKPALGIPEALEVLRAETDRGWRDPHAVQAFGAMVQDGALAA
jgi:putative two-component system response regulator